MPSNGRQSPRAAIRDWLSQNVGNLTARPRLETADDDKERTSRVRHRSRHHAGADGLPLHPHTTRSRNRQDSQRGRFQECPGDEIKARRLDGGGVSLAERFNLHAPFRSFGDGNDFEDLNASRSDYAKKRRRSPSSASSFLEPAALPVVSANDKLDRKASSRNKYHSRHNSAFSQSSSETSQPLSETSTSPEKATKTYERRSRHKTKQDRYELKQNKTARKQKSEKKDKKKREARKNKKLKLHKKSGAVLGHDFWAQNVAQDRLTLKPAAPLGLFKRGRASSPVRRTGLPDLTFSEMTFLNTRRDRSEDPAKSTDKNKRRTKDKAVDTEAAISRYFASANARDIDAANAEKEPVRSISISRPSERYHTRPNAERFAFLERSSLPPVELPETPFLGFGSVGGSLVSPVRRSELTESSTYRSRSIHREVSPIPSASYFTWSKTGSPSHRPSGRGDNENVPPVPPKTPQTIGDLSGNTSTDKTAISGVPVSLVDNAGDAKAIYESNSGDGCTADVMETPGGRVKNSPQGQDLHSLPIVNDSKQLQAQNIEHLSAEKIHPQQAPQTAVINGTEIPKTHTDPLLMKSNDLNFERSEDLVNATLKLFLEKYGANFKGLSVATDNAKTPKLSDAATSEEDERHSAYQSPANADAQGGKPEAEAEGSDPSRVRESNNSPRPSSRRTMHSETRPSEKPSRDSHPSNEITQAPLDMQGSFNDPQGRQSPIRSLPHHDTDAQSAWNGYKSIHERQPTFEEPRFNPYNYQTQDDPSLEVDIMNGPRDISGNHLEAGYGSGFNDVYDDYGTRNPYDTSAYHVPLEEHSDQGQFRSEGTWSQHFAEAANHARAMEGLDHRWPNGAHERLVEESPPFPDYNLSERGQIDPYKKAYTHYQLASHSTATDPANREHLPCQRRIIPDESPRAFYSRPLTQGSSHSSVLQWRALPDQPDDASLSGFWKPHRLY